MDKSEAAKKLLESPLIQEAFELIESNIVDAFKLVKASDIEGLQLIKLQHHALAELQRHLLALAQAPQLDR